MSKEQPRYLRFVSPGTGLDFIAVAVDRPTKKGRKVALPFDTLTLRHHTDGMLERKDSRYWGLTKQLKHLMVMCDLLSESPRPMQVVADALDVELQNTFVAYEQLWKSLPTEAELTGTYKFMGYPAPPPI